MDIQEIRRIQLKEIIKQHFNDVASSFAQGPDVLAKIKKESH